MIVVFGGNGLLGRERARAAAQHGTRMVTLSHEAVSLSPALSGCAYSTSVVLLSNWDTSPTRPKSVVQIPYRYFPIEPHWLFPGLQFLPQRARIGHPALATVACVAQSRTGPSGYLGS